VAAAALAGAAHPAVLSYCAQTFRDLPERLEAIALNAAADDATIAFLAGLPHKRIVDIVSNNQERMLRSPDIVEALGQNPLTGRAVIDRILGFLGLQRRPDEISDEPEPEALPPPAPVNDEEARAVLAAVLGEDVSGFAQELLVEGAAPLDEESTKSLHALVQKMSVFEKIKLARVGNQEARSLLVRDRNRVVAVAAITSPKITDNEVTAIAQSRNVCDEVLRIISHNRLWTRNYKCKLALATNPRTPQPTAIQFASFLNDNDLRALVKSKDVPSAVSTHARRMLMKKGKL
jgi:hypothetical protein